MIEDLQSGIQVTRKEFLLGVIGFYGDANRRRTSGIESIGDGKVESRITDQCE